MSNDDFELKVRPRTKRSVTFSMPVDTLEALSRIAENYEMSVEALIRYYIGQGLRRDVAKQSGEQHPVIAGTDSE